jgi:hypothetical protein
VPDFITKDSGQRVDFASGMRRDVADDKPNFSLCLAEGVPFEDQLLTRWAALMQRGAVKYGDRNWELASSKEELERFKSSALRHMMQWATGANPEEDHAAAVLFNLAAYEVTRLKLEVSTAEPEALTLRVGAKVRSLVKTSGKCPAPKMEGVITEHVPGDNWPWKSDAWPQAFTADELEVIG